MAPATPFDGVLVLAFGAVAAYRWYCAEGRRVKRELRQYPRCTLGEMLDDQRARVVGHAKALDRCVEAPISGRTCLYFIATVKSRGRTLFEERAGVPFVLEDGTGCAIVDPAGARFGLTVDFKVATLANTDARVVALFERNGRNIWTTDKAFLRYYEAVIEVDEEVAVLGAGVHDRHSNVPQGDAYRGDPSTPLSVKSSARSPLLISDSPETTF